MLVRLNYVRSIRYYHWTSLCGIEENRLWDAHITESHSRPFWKHVNSQEIPLAQVALVNVVFARGQWCRTTLVSSWKTGRSYPRVIGGDVGGSNDFVCREEAVCDEGCRRCNEDKACRRISTPLGMYGSIHQRRTVVSSSGILYRCPAYLSPFSVGPFLSSFSSILHSCWALIPGERPRAHSPLRSLSRPTSLSSSLPLFPRLYMSLLRAFLPTFLRSWRFETASKDTCDTVFFLLTKIIYFRSTKLKLPKSCFLVHDKRASLFVKDNIYR